MQVYKYTVHGQNSVVMEKPNKKTQKACQQCELQEPFHEMAPETSSVIGYGEVHVQCEENKTKQRNRRKTHQLQKPWSMPTSPGQQLEPDVLIEMNKPLRKHHSERSTFSNLTIENPTPSTFLKQDSSNNLQSRYLSYSRHSCCSGSLELHLHVDWSKRLHLHPC